MMTARRHAGVLLHPTSLPGADGIGSLGTELFEFLDFLSQAKFSLWQVLPLTPPAAGNSPYSAYSAFAGNHLLIDLHQLVDEGDLLPQAIQNNFPQDHVDFDQVTPWKESLLHKAAENFFNQGKTPRLQEFWQFCDTTYWLHDYALFTVGPMSWLFVNLRLLNRLQRNLARRLAYRNTCNGSFIDSGNR
jgi:4-alpha-glucanotransferase